MKTKKIFAIQVLALILALFFTVECFAAVCIDFSFTEEINGEQYTVVMGKTDSDDFDEIGVTVNGKDYKLEDEKIDHVRATKRFGVAFKGNLSSLTAVTPYVKNNDVKITGNDFEVNKNVSFPMAVKKEITPPIEYLDTSYRAKTTGNGLEQERIWVDTVSGYNWINFLKIDISSIKDKIGLTKNVTLSLYSVMQPTKEGLTSMNVRIFMVPDSFKWDELKAERTGEYNFGIQKGSTYGLDYEKYILNKTPASTLVKELNDKQYEWVDLNITPAVYQAIKNNEDFAYVIIAPDHSEIDKTTNASFRYYTEGNEKYNYAPKIKYSEEIPTIKLEDEFAMIEAEDCYLSSAYKKEKIEGASGGSVIKPYKTVVDSAESGALRYADNGVDDMSICFDVEKEGYYTIWMRVYSTYAHGNFISHINDSFTKRQFSTDLNSFTWGAAETVKLTKGKNIYGIMPRLSTMYVDKILITSSEYYTPVGMGEKPSVFKLGKEGETLRGVYYPVPEYTPLTEHPRLYLNSENIETVKKNLNTAQNKTVWNNVQNLAKSDMDCTVDSEAVYSYSAQVHRYLEACAFMYAIDKVNNKEYGEKAVKGLTEYLSTISYNSSYSLEFARSGIVQYIAKVYDWCYDLLDDEEKTFFIKKSLAMASKMECGWPSIQFNAFVSGHAHESSIQCDMLSLAIATYEDYPDIWNVAAGRYFHEFIPINQFWHTQGPFQGDGDAYGRGRYGYEAKGNLILYSLGLSDLVPESEHLMAYNQIYRRRPDGAFMRDGDIYDRTLLAGNSYIGEPGPLFSGAVRYNDPYLKYELYKMRNNGAENAGLSEGNTTVEFLIFNDPNLAPQSYDNLPLTMYGGIGHNILTARTGWDQGMDANTMIVSMKGGGRHRGDHQHLDAGNFTIYYKGLLALDSGEYQGMPFYDENGNYITNTHAGSDHQKDYQQRTIAHNCILVYNPDEVMPGSRPGGTNDGGQVKSRNLGSNNSDTYEEAVSDERIHATRLGVDYGPDMNKPAYSYIKTDITNAYTEKMKDYERTMLFMNFFDDVYPGALIVLDKVESSNPEFKKTWLLHSQEEPEINGNTQVIKRTEFGYNGRLINTTLLPKAEDLNVEKIGGEGKEYWVDGKNATAVTYLKGDESGKWRIEVSPKASKAKDYFLNVIQVSDNDDAISTLPVEKYETESHYGVQIKDRVAYLSKQEERISDDVEVYINSATNEKYKWVVDGLNTGNWEVYDKNGVIIAAADVTEEGGIAYFEAPAGNYTLKMKASSDKVPSKDFNFLNAVGEINPKEVKISYNSMYQYLTEDNKVQRINNQIYLPFEKILSIMDDKYYKYSVDETKINIVFEDDEYTFFLNEKKVLKKFNNSEEITEIKVNYTPMYINGKYYIHSSILSKVFGKTCTVDSTSDIVWIKNSFERANDFLVNSNDELRINVADATGTNFYYAYKPYMAHDGDLGTLAGSDTLNGTLVYEFEKEEFLDYVSIYWNDGASKDYSYEFYVSSDGVNFEPAASGHTGFTIGYVDYPIGKNAKYFKIVSKGNVVNDWLVIKEMEFYRK